MNVERFVLLTHRYLLGGRISEEFASELSIVLLELLELLGTLNLLILSLLSFVQPVNVLDLLLDVVRRTDLV